MTLTPEEAVVWGTPRPWHHKVLGWWPCPLVNTAWTGPAWLSAGMFHEDHSLPVGMHCVGVCSPGASGRLLLPKREVGDGHLRSPEGGEGCPWRGAPGCWRPGALTLWNHSTLLLCAWGTPTCHTPPRADWRVPLNPRGHLHSEAGRGQGLVLDLVDWPWASTKLTAFTMVPF